MVLELNRPVGSNFVVHVLVGRLVLDLAAPVVPEPSGLSHLPVDLLRLLECFSCILGLPILADV